MSKIINVGSINIDLVSNVKNFVKPGETIEALDFNTYPGGKGANQAVALAQNEEDVFFIGAIGNDEYGRYLIELLNSYHINTEGIVIKDSIPTGRAMIFVNEDSENSIIIIHGANYELSGEDILRYEKEFKDADAIIMQLEINDEVLIKTAEISAKYHIPLFLNPAPSRKIPDIVLKNTFAITPNQNELSSLTNMPCDNLEAIKKAASYLKDKYHIHVIVTLGSKGAFIADENIIIESYKVKAVDTTAAGDSFNGAFVSNYLKTKDFVEATKFANAFAALSITKKGAIPSIPSKSDILEFIENH